MSWFYQEDRQAVGPISKSQLQTLIEEGRIDGRTLVRSIAMNEWHPLAELVHPKKPVPETTPELPPQPPLPPTPPVAVRPADAEPAPSQAVPLPFRFSGSGGEYFRVWIVNVLLSILTAGVYSAWAKVRRKQYFYGNTSVAGAAFRYLADPLKILKGRAVVFIGFLIYSLINQIFPLAAIILSIGLISAVPWLVVRSLAFNAGNSSWRNIRFNFLGTYGGAAKVFILWPILIPFTLGLLGPYVFFRQKKYIVENSAYGNTQFQFHASTRDYYRIAGAFLLPVLIFAILSGLIFTLTPDLSFTTLFLAGGLYLYGLAFFSVRASNLAYNSASLLQHRFDATMKVGRYGIIVLTNTLATVCTLGLFHPFAVVRAYRYKIEHLALLPAGSLEQFVAAELKQTNTLGEEMSDFMDFDIGI